MSTPVLDFLRLELQAPGSNLVRIARETGISRRSLQMLKQGASPGARFDRVELLARHLGYDVTITKAGTVEHQHELQS